MGWSLGRSMEVGLVKGVLEMAVGQRHPEAGLIHYTDRGSHMPVMGTAICCASMGWCAA